MEDKKNKVETVAENVQNAATVNTTTPANFFTKYKNYIIGGIGAGVLAGIIWFAMGGKEANADKELKAMKDLQAADQMFQMDSFGIALNGDSTTAGYEKVLKKISGTKEAKVAHIKAAQCALNLNDAKKALEHLDKAGSSFGPQIRAKIFALKGDAYSLQATTGNQKSAFDDALDFYQKAANEFTDDIANAPVYLFKQAKLLEEMNKPEDAKKVYQQIMEKYPSMDNRSVKDDVVKSLAKLGVIN
jgi:tetratricopeptide (TPR) repeat protein